MEKKNSLLLLDNIAYARLDIDYKWGIWKTCAFLCRPSKVGYEE